MKFIAMCVDTFREIRDKKMVLVFGLITLIFALVYLFVFQIEPAGDGKIKVTSFNESEVMIATSFISRQMMVFSQVTSGILNFLFIIAFASVMANLLKPGTLDLHLSKPLFRSQLLLYKFLACVVNVWLLMSVLGGSIWLLLTIKSSAFTLKPLLFIAITPLVFAIGFSMIVFCCILTRGAGSGISVYLIYAYLLQGFLSNREPIKLYFDNDVFSYVIDKAYHILPKINESMEIVTQLHNNRAIELYPLTSSLTFMTGILILSCLIFRSKDY